MLCMKISGAKRFVFTVIKKSMMVPETMDTLMQIFAHSVNAMATGLTPEEDWLGESLGPMQYLAGGWQAILTRVRGDWDFSVSA